MLEVLLSFKVFHLVSSITVRADVSLGLAT